MSQRYNVIDNVTYYKCDVSKWEEVEAVSKKIIEEVSPVTMISTSSRSNII
jgi:hypothetical protein